MLNIQGTTMMTTEKHPETSNDHNPHEDDAALVAAHMMAKWHLLHIDTEALTLDEVHRDYMEAHKDIHPDEDTPEDKA